MLDIHLYAKVTQQIHSQKNVESTSMYRFNGSMTLVGRCMPPGVDHDNMAKVQS